MGVVSTLPAGSQCQRVVGHWSAQVHGVHSLSCRFWESVRLSRSRALLLLPARAPCASRTVPSSAALRAVVAGSRSRRCAAQVSLHHPLLGEALLMPGGTRRPVVYCSITAARLWICALPCDQAWVCPMPSESSGDGWALAQSSPVSFGACRACCKLQLSGCQSSLLGWPGGLQARCHATSALSTCRARKLGCLGHHQPDQLSQPGCLGDPPRGARTAAACQDATGCLLSDRQP